MQDMQKFRMGSLSPTYDPILNLYCVWSYLKDLLCSCKEEFLLTSTQREKFLTLSWAVWTKVLWLRIRIVSGLL